MAEIVVPMMDPTGDNFDHAGVVRALEVWREAQQLLAPAHSPPFILGRGADQWYEISLDASCMMQFLEENRQYWIDLERGSDSGVPIHAHSATICLSVTPVNGASEGDSLNRATTRFLQQLFLAMNIARPGTCYLPESSPTTRAPSQREPKYLSSTILDDMFCRSADEGWPVYRSVAFDQVWDWLHSELAYDIDVAETPSHKALFGLLRLCSREADDPDNIPLLAQVFESLLAGRKDENSAGVIAKRIVRLIGEPQANKKWFSELYNLRSRMVHGDAPVLRPGLSSFLHPAARRISEKLELPQHMGIAALLALLQDMVVRGIHVYSFEEKLVGG